MAMNGSIDTVVSGIVRSVNEKGLKLEGHDEWLNVSKFAVGVVLPERGAVVTCTLDKGGFLRAVAAADGAVLSPPRTGAPGAASGTRDRTITRLAVLKAAAEYAASKPQSASADVLKIAACWERWVLRDDAPADDGLTDAF
jgi:hypothetical protein